ncbi:MAG: diacylglycerol kinase, catalytic region [Alphaproteobacteria bacterium]|nr:diacylglycerol kinase, catalytic region [Alphaproteobacteria bacterium]
MADVALLSNGRSAGSQALLAGVRAYCASSGAIFHYEVDDLGQIEAALRVIARVRPKVLVVNGGEQAVQAVLAGLVSGDSFDGEMPPIAVLPIGRTNLIARDLGAEGDPIAVLERIVEVARGDLSAHVVRRELIALSTGRSNQPVFGMFAGAGGLAEAMLYCRDRLYPLGLPSRLCHFLTGCAALFSLVPMPGRLQPVRPAPMRLTMQNDRRLEGSFQLLMVTTLERMLASRQSGCGALKVMAVERRWRPMLRTALDAMRGRLGARGGGGVHLSRGVELRIEGEGSGVILDGALFRARAGEPIVLRTTAALPFLSLAAA